MTWYEIINAKSDSYMADRDAEEMLRQLAMAFQAEDGLAAATVRKPTVRSREAPCEP